MCFSATASFVVSGTLAAVGTASLQITPRKQKMIALVPVLFAVQQAFEGFQWLAVRPSMLSTVAVYGFLFFAFLVWPIYVPLTVFKFDQKRRGVLKWFLAAGVVIDIFLIGTLFLVSVPVQVVGHSIRYGIVLPGQMWWAICYVFIVCGALFFSSKPAFRWFGIAVFTAAAVAALFFYVTFTSVWCFFAALLSIAIYFYLRKQRKLSR